MQAVLSHKQTQEASMPPPPGSLWPSYLCQVAEVGHEARPQRQDVSAMACAMVLKELKTSCPPPSALRRSHTGLARKGASPPTVKLGELHVIGRVPPVRQPNKTPPSPRRCLIIAIPITRRQADPALLLGWPFLADPGNASSRPRDRVGLGSCSISCT
jgi:hypothetical protein